MGLYTGLVANLLFPLQETLKKHNTLAIRKAMEDSQWWSQEKLEQYRLERLRNLLVKVRNHVPYYRDCFASLDFKPQSISSLADLNQLPLLTKTIIRAEGDRMKSEVATLQYRRICRRAANLLHWHRARQPRCCRQVACYSLVGCRYWRPRDCGLGQPDRTVCAGSTPALARSADANTTTPGLPNE